MRANNAGRHHSSSAPVRTAVVGFGAMGYLHALAIRAQPAMQLVAFADPAPSGYVPVGTAHFTDAAEMIAATSPNLVVIASPPAKHADGSRLALAAGAHLLCEKPLAHDFETARAMAETAAREKPRTFVNLQLRMSPLRMEMKRRVEAGDVGRIIAIRALGGYPGYHERAPAWYGRPQTGGGALMEFGTHLVDQMLWIGGPIRRVAGLIRGATTEDHDAHEDYVAAILEFDRGGVGEIVISTLGSASTDRVFEITGEHGALRLIGETELVRIANDGTPIAIPTPPEDYQSLTGDPADSYTQPLQRLYAQLADVLTRGASAGPLATYMDAVRAQAVIEAIRASRDGLRVISDGGDTT